LLPRSFFDTGPLPGHPWVAMPPPYNEHPVRDIGALNLGLAAVLSAAAVRMERRLARIALVAYPVFTVPHLVFHSTHLEHFAVGEAVGQTVALAVAVVLPVTLLFLTARRGAPGGETA